jgi:c-di-GMP-binding flagellar brake protein YcgR
MEDEMERKFQLNEDLFVETESFSFGFNSRIIGVKQERFLLLDPPPDPPGSSQLKVDDTVRVKCFQTPIVRFETQILRVVSNPPMLLLRYPTSESMQRADRRGQKREKIFLQLTCTDLEERESTESFEAYMLDISHWGCLILSDCPLRLGGSVLLSFRVPWLGESIEVKGRVVHSISTERGNRSGMQFIESDPDHQERLNEFVRFLGEA